ncbi:hypothetical protein MJT46_018726 [Ovis ammon polii x Ovis aries]|nr:hypothetical protein MJT46_018726 [Ovis ammon polii x Ovis aries]
MRTQPLNHQMVPTVYKAVNQGKQGSGCSLTSADTGGQQVDKSGATDIYEGACRAHQRRGFLCARRPGPLPVQDFAAFQCANGTFWVFPESLSLSPLTGRKLLFVRIRLKRDSCNDFQMLASSLLADRGGCGRLRDGNQKPGQMYHVSVSSAHIWLQYRQR